MNDLDLEGLGDIWRQRPDPKELDELKRAAEAVRRRAKWSQVVDVVAAIAVAGVVLFLVLSNPTADTLLVGGGAILILLVSQIRSRRLRQQELRSLSGSVEQMLDQSIERVQATLRRARSGLIFLVPALLVGYFVAYVVERRSGTEISERFNAQPELSTIILVVAGLAIAGGFVQVVRTLRKSRRELERLKVLRDSYRQEQETDLAG
jgi:succinate dehydrogenase/fumarate reductase cytochrome b subunit